MTIPHRVEKESAMNKIVVGVDGSAGSQVALEWAAAEARLRGARLEPVIAWELPPMTEYYYVPTRSEVERAAVAAVEKMVAQLDSTGIVVEPETVEASPAVALVRAASDADLLVVGTTGHGAFVGMMLGSVSLRVVTHAPCPVVVVPSPPA
jgi:nucleotide-binding universal stress UspA family protein